MNIKTNRGYDDFVDELSAARSSPIAIFQEFRILFGSGGRGVHCFFEGQDDKQFFLQFVRSRCEDLPVYPYVCDGKNGVVELRRMVYANGDECPSVLYFIDKDIDEFFGAQVDVCEFTFMTSCYSFENYIVNATTLKNILDEFAHLRQGGRREQEILEKFESLHDEFVKRMRALMALAAACRAAGLRPSLGNVAIDSVVRITEDVQFQETRRGRQVYKNGLQCEVDTVSLGQHVFWTRHFSVVDFKAWLRGKWELWFFNEFLRRVFEKMERDTKGAGRRVRVPGSIRYGEVIEVAAGRCAEPHDLCDFLDRKFSEIREI